VLSTLRPARCYQHGPDGPCQVVTLMADSKRRSLLTAGDNDEMFMTKNLNDTPKYNKTTFTVTVRSDKSVAYVTGNKRLCSTFCTLEANYWQTGSIARASLRQQGYLLLCTAAVILRHAGWKQDCGKRCVKRTCSSSCSVSHVSKVWRENETRCQISHVAQCFTALVLNCS